MTTPLQLVDPEHLRKIEDYINYEHLAIPEEDYKNLISNRLLWDDNEYTSTDGSIRHVPQQPKWINKYHWKLEYIDGKPYYIRNGIIEYSEPNPHAWGQKTKKPALPLPP